MNCIFDRIKVYAKSIGMTKAAIEQKAGLPNGTFKRNMQTLRESTKSKLEIAFPDLDINWLITGVGNSPKNTPGEILEENNTNQQTQSGMDTSFAMDYIAALKDQIAVLKGESATLKEQLKEKDALIRRLTEQGVDKSLSRRLGAVKEKQDKLDY